MRLRAFPGRGPEVDARYERAAQWILATLYGSDRARTWCKQHDIPIIKAQGEGSASLGGVLVPTELARAIFDLREVYGSFRKRARIWPMASDSTSIPRRVEGAGAFFMGENAPPPQESSAPVDSMGLTAKKIGALIRLSSELEEDAAESIVDYVANEVAHAFAKKEDDCAFNGDGTSKYGGMYGLGPRILSGNHNKARVDAASGHSSYDAIDWTDLSNLVAAVQASAIPNAAWFISQTGFAKIMAGGVNNYISTIGPDVPPMYWGYPVILTQVLPLTMTGWTGQLIIAFGDMYAAGVLGQRRQITLALSPHRYFEQDQIAVLGTERFDAVIHDIGDNNAVGSLAGMIGA